MIDINTSRLLITKVLITDTTFIYKLLNSNSWLKHIGNRNITDLESASKYIQQTLLDSYHKNDFGLFKMVLKSTNKNIGLCGLMKRNDEDPPDIGFAIFEEFEGNGFTHEAVTAIIEHSKILGIFEIWAYTTPENIRSQKVLTRAGFEKNGQRQMKGNSQKFDFYTIQISDNEHFE